MSFTARQLAELGQLFGREADAQHDFYAWPPLAPPSAETEQEIDRLGGIAIELEERAIAAGWDGPMGDAIVIGRK